MPLGFEANGAWGPAAEVMLREVAELAHKNRRWITLHTGGNGLGASWMTGLEMLNTKFPVEAPYFTSSTRVETPQLPYHILWCARARA